MSRSSRNTKIIKASPGEVYAALIDPRALETWQAPDSMTGNVHDFDLREGGGYTMSLYYPESEPGAPGKTGGREDRFRVKFVTLVPAQKIVQTVLFDTNDPAFSGEMTMTITLTPVGNGTEITSLYENIPPGIDPKDNEAGTASSLEKLAGYVEGK